MLRRLLTIALLSALAQASGAFASSVIAFDRPSALPNERVKVTSALAMPVRLYLVREEQSGAVTRRVDRRLSFIGVVKASRALTFSMPPLAVGTYRLATWDGARLRLAGPRLRLRPTEGCPATRPNGNRPPGQPLDVPWYGNGLLWASVGRDGTYTVRKDQVEADGTIGNKLLWVTTPPAAKPTISGERIDGLGAPLRVARVNTGSSSHMSPVSFATPGCWRVTARLADVSLTYVVQVAVSV